ncbi:hypothetical protein IEQ34_005922 [Dendrobium chrysotoxum]|uniref:Auxin efflux carrier component n=1 Tax=Dendrobium chrysotoxum TaxID=161865 RepID=A0AAV7HCN8_DENCH|nr:hypothetical protein IEQ34_005922 [Dendrobium chrysotoxum]
MFLVFASVKYWKIFSPKQCFGINRFAAHFACPFLFFDVIPRFQLKNINLPFLATDSISKVLVLLILLNWVNFVKSGSLEWLITLFSLTTLPTALIVGIPLLTSMYGKEQEARNSMMMKICEKSAQLENNTSEEYVYISIAEDNTEGPSELHDTICFVCQKSKHNSIIEESGRKETKKVKCRRLMMIKLIMKTVYFKLVRNPNAYASLLGLLWILISSSLNGLITLFSLTTLPNTLIVGSPSSLPMYGNEQEARNSIMMNISEKSVQLENNIGEEDVHISIAEENTEGLSELQDSVSVQKASNGVYEKSEHSRDIEESEGKENKKVESGRLMMIKLIMKMVCFKLVRNPNAYASLLGLLWVLISSRLKIKKPLIMDNSVKILSNTGQGMAVFSLGIIACGNRLAVYGMLTRFVAGPATMLLSSVLVGLRKTTLSVAVVQAALPQAALTFVYAKEYDLHAELLSTVVIFGMIASLPVTILYSILLGL